MSGPDCVAAIDWLAEAVGTRFTELVCGYWFRPVFALPSSSGNGSGRQERLDEEDFFAYVADKVSEAAPSLERLVEVFLAEAPKIPLQLVSQLYGPDEETPAMAHAVKALIALDPTRYAVLRRYISAIDVEHDSFVKTTLARFFGQSNGWRDVEAVRLGIVWMLEQWCGGWGGYGSLWTDFGMADEVKRRFTSDDFARLFLQEAQVFFSPSDEDGSINRAAWNDNSAANFLSESRARLFGDPGAFNEGVLSEIDRALAHKPN